MGKEKILRPDSSEVKSMIAEAKRIDNSLYTMLKSEREYSETAQLAAEALYNDRIRAALEKMDIEHINRGKLGLRVGLLRENGIDNIWQLSQCSFKQLCDIDGLGEQSARKIMETGAQILENTKETTRIRIRMDAPSKVDDELIRTLYMMIHFNKIREDGMSLYKKHHEPLIGEIEMAKKSLGGFSWIFKSSSSKSEIVSAVENIRLRLSGEFGNSLQAWENMKNVSPATYWSDYQSNAPAYYTALESLGLIIARQESGGLPAQLAAEIEAQPINLDNLKATLRSYQTFGVKYIVHQKKCLLGDEMGLGKTVQAIASMVALNAEGENHFMVVCPASVLINWCREIKKFSNLDVISIHGNDELGLFNWCKNGGVAVTTFESISRFTLPEEFRISMIITDEAHYVKNPEAKRTQALQVLLKKTEYVLFMSGTPLENRVEEMCFLISCLQPEIANELEEVKYISTADQFRMQLAPVYLRRTREDVLQELPDLIEKEQWCVLGESERRKYKEAVLSGNFMAIRQVSWNVDNLNDSSKAERLSELCNQAMEQKRKVIVFSFFRSTIHKVMELLSDRCIKEPITGDISPERRQEIVDEFEKSADGSVLVSQVQAGGTGLNIQSASVVIFCEPQLKPSIENQAISRAYRMGQVRDVLVYRLLADDTIDESVVELLKNKQLQFDSFADESVVGEESLKEISTSWITKLIEEEKRRVAENV